MSTLYQKIFAAGYDPIMESIEKKVFYKHRHTLINQLEGRILEVGAGTGVNFKFYGTNTDVIAVEPSLAMIQKAKNKITEKQNIQIINYGINAKEVNNFLLPESLDAAICTLVLCTVPDYILALENIKKWLKPGGKLLILEHIHAKKSIPRKVQTLLNPLWNIIGDGCHLTRNTDDVVKRLGLTLESEVYFNKGLLWYQAVFRKQGCIKN